MSSKRCAYCGNPIAKGSGKTRDHVFPRSLYPRARKEPYSRITVPSCDTCNHRWSDDEELFRNVVNSAGDFNQPAREVFRAKIQPSLQGPGGARRIVDLLRISESVQVSGANRLKIYPARDPRVLGVVRKIVAGLRHYHGIGTALDEARIWADILRFQVPGEYVERLKHEQRGPDVVEYWYGVRTEPGVDSVWILRFYERTTFLALVAESVGGGFPWEAEAN